MNKGYRGMLRDRLLPSWNLALLWCKVKNRWVEKAYAENIARAGVSLRSELCKFVTGHKNKHGITATFMSTVDPDGFLYGENHNEYEMWRSVDKWIRWFSVNQMFIYDMIQDYYQQGKDDEYIIKNLNYPYVNEKLIRFMIKNKHIYYGTK